MLGRKVPTPAPREMPKHPGETDQCDAGGQGFNSGGGGGVLAERSTLRPARRAMRTGLPFRAWRGVPVGPPEAPKAPEVCCR